MSFDDILGISKKKRKVIKTEKKPKNDVLRYFTDTQKNVIWDQQNGKCAGTSCEHSILEKSYVKFHHKKGWADKGQTVIENGQAVCSDCHDTGHTKSSSNNAGVPVNVNTKKEKSLKILTMRLVNGEITEEEYQKTKVLLEN